MHSAFGAGYDYNITHVIYAHLSVTVTTALCNKGCTFIKLSTNVTTFTVLYNFQHVTPVNWYSMTHVV